MLAALLRQPRLPRTSRRFYRAHCVKACAHCAHNMLSLGLVTYVYMCFTFHIHLMGCPACG